VLVLALFHSVQYSERTNELADAMDFLRRMHADKLSSYNGTDFREMLILLNAASMTNGSRSLTTEVAPQQTKPTPRHHAIASTTIATGDAIHRLRRRDVATPPLPPPPLTRMAKLEIATVVAVAEQSPMPLRRMPRQTRNLPVYRISRFPMIADSETRTLGRTAGRVAAVSNAGATTATARTEDERLSDQSLTESRRALRVFGIDNKKRPIRMSASLSKLDENEIIERRPGVDDISDQSRYVVKYDHSAASDDVTVSGVFHSLSMVGDDNDDNVFDIKFDRHNTEEKNEDINGNNRITTDAWNNAEGEKHLSTWPFGQDIYHVNGDNIADADNETLLFSYSVLDSSTTSQLSGKKYIDMLLKIAHLLHYIGIGILTFFVIQVSIARRQANQV